MTNKTKEIAGLLVQVLGIVSIVILAFFLGMIIGVFVGAIGVKDVSAFSEWMRFLYGHPMILAAAGLFSVWSIKIWIKDEERESYRPTRRTGKLSIQKPQRS